VPESSSSSGPSPNALVAENRVGKAHVFLNRHPIKFAVTIRLDERNALKSSIDTEIFPSRANRLSRQYHCLDSPEGKADASDSSSFRRPLRVRQV
jgi:hypothetical protein